MQKKLDAMINQKPEPKIEPGIVDLNSSNFEQTISAENPTFPAVFAASARVFFPRQDQDQHIKKFAWKKPGFPVFQKKS